MPERGTPCHRFDRGWVAGAQGPAAAWPAIAAPSCSHRWRKCHAGQLRYENHKKREPLVLLAKTRLQGYSEAPITAFPLPARDFLNLPRQEQRGGRRISLLHLKLIREGCQWDFPLTSVIRESESRSFGCEISPEESCTNNYFLPDPMLLPSSKCNRLATNVVSDLPVFPFLAFVPC